MKYIRHKTIKAFSYLELIISMSVVVMVVLLSTPFLTHANRSSSSVYGEFRCFTEYDEASGKYKLYQQQRYNASTLSEKKEVSSGYCTFSKPQGATTFTITVVGGGGGGAKPLMTEDDLSINQVNNYQKSTTSLSALNKTTCSSLTSKAKGYLNGCSDCNSSACTFTYDDDGFSTTVTKYITKNIQQAIAIYPVLAAEAGEVISRQSVLTSDVIKIYKCQNSSIPTEYAEYEYCVGEGGAGGNGNLKLNYYVILSILQDLVYSYNYPTGIYTGLGNGSINDSTKSLLAGALTNGTSDNAYKYLLSYISNKTSARYNSLKSELETILNNQSKSSRIKGGEYESNGYQGEYSRFKFSNNDIQIAQGGSGGKTSSNLEYLYPGCEISKFEMLSSSGYYYLMRQGAVGEYDSSIGSLAGGAGGYCTLANSSITNCEGANAQYIGSGGGAGAITFVSDSGLNSYSITSFAIDNSTYLNKKYDVYNSSSTDLPEIKNIIGGNGGNGAGGAIIISW